jgi:transcription termination factor Rho
MQRSVIWAVIASTFDKEQEHVKITNIVLEKK